MSETWRMGKALSELMLRHDVTLAAPSAVALSPAGSGPMLLSGLASTVGNVDCERVAFAPFAFDPLPDNVELHYNHTGVRAGYIEALAHDADGALGLGLCRPS